VHCFRITRNPDAVAAFDGIGASMYPGRWNERNQRAVYVTTRLPLGILEVLVQDAVTTLRGYGAFPLEIPDDIALETADRAAFSPSWRTAFAGRTECRAIGEAWRARKATVGLIVPSAVVPEAFAFGDFNIVLDPTHPDFQRLAIAARLDLDIDARLQSLVRPARP
jgi:RES domain-containing protein